MAKLEVSVHPLKDAEEAYRKMLEESFGRGEDAVKNDPSLKQISAHANYSSSCLLVVYIKQKGTRLKCFGAKYENGSFEAKEGGCFSTKTFKYAQDIHTPVFIETKEGILYHNIGWDSTQSARIVIPDATGEHLLAIYSDSMEDMQAYYANLEYSRVKGVLQKDKSQKVSELVRKILPRKWKTEVSEILLGEMENLANQTANARKSPTRMPTTISHKGSSSGFKDSSLDADTQHGLGSVMGDSIIHSSMRKEDKIRSDFGGVSQSKYMKQELGYPSMVEGLPGSLVYPRQSTIPIDTSNVKKSAVRVAPDDVSQVIAVHCQNGKDTAQSQIKASTIKKSALKVKEPVLPPKTYSRNLSPTKSTSSHNTLVSGVASQVPKIDYFTNVYQGLDISKASTLGGPLLDPRNEVLQYSKFRQGESALESAGFVLSTIVLLAPLDPSNLLVEIYSRGMKIQSTKASTLHQSSLTNRQLVRSVQLNTKKKLARADMLCFWVELEEAISQPQGNTEVYEIILSSEATRSTIASCSIGTDFLLLLNRNEASYAIPMRSGAFSALAVLRASRVTNHKDRKAKLACENSTIIEQARRNITDFPNLFENALTIGFKKKQVKELVFLCRAPESPQHYLLSWLLVTKKFKLSTSKKTSSADTSPTHDKFKSSILQSLRATKKESSLTDTTPRISLPFHRMIRHLEKQAELASSSGSFTLGPIAESSTREYFRSLENRFKIIEFLFDRIMADYYRRTPEAHKMDLKGPGRDYYLIKYFISNYCEEVQKIVMSRNIELPLWIIDHILGVNSGLLREPSGPRHLNFLFMLVAIHPSDEKGEFTWRANTYLHLFILSRLEKLLKNKVGFIEEVYNSPEALYNLVTSKLSFYEEFLAEFEDLSMKIVAKEIGESNIQSMLKSFANPEESTALKTAEEIFVNLAGDKKLTRERELPALERDIAMKISQLKMKPAKMVNVVKSRGHGDIKMVLLKVHKVLNAEYNQSDYCFRASWAGMEPLSSKEGIFQFGMPGSKGPMIEVRMLVEGVDLLHRENYHYLASATIPLRRLMSNVLHSQIVGFYDDKNKKEYLVHLTFIFIEAGNINPEKFLDAFPCYYNSTSNFMQIGNFNHPISNFQDMISRKLSRMAEEAGFKGATSLIKYTKGHITPEEVKMKLEVEKIKNYLKVDPKLAHTNMKSFRLSIATLISNGDLPLLEDYLLRYFGDLQTIAPSEIVHAFQAMFELASIDASIIEITLLLEKVLKKPLAPKVKSAVLLLDVPKDVMDPKARRPLRFDLEPQLKTLIGDLDQRGLLPRLAFGDFQSLFLLKDLAEKSKPKCRPGERNLFILILEISGLEHQVSFSFDENYRTPEQIDDIDPTPDSSTLLLSQSYMIDLSPLDCNRLSRNDLRVALTQLPHLEYLRQAVQPNSLQA